MRPALLNTVPSTSRRQARAPRTSYLDFRPVRQADLATLLPLLHSAPWRTCDYTAGGLMMWTDMFNYSFCLRGNTLFVKGISEAGDGRPAFWVPVGAMPLEQSVRAIADYCRETGITPEFTAVPEDALPVFEALGAEITELTDWADYLYDAQSLATLSGKKFNKKRNHVNRFLADHPDYTFEPVSDANIDAVRRFFASLELPEGKSEMAEYERAQVAAVLQNPTAWPFIGAVLSVPELGPVAFTFGEIAGQTLHVHIEKMNHEVAGAGETINRLFAEMITSRYPFITAINRQDDAGDPGLRRAKQSYNPIALLRKFNVVL